MGVEVDYNAICEKASEEGLLNEEDSSVIFYDFGLLSKTLENLRNYFPKSCHHTVAVKTNPLSQVLNAIGWEGVGHEAASAGELALAAKHSNEFLVYDGPAKRANELEDLLENKDRLLVNANSLTDLQKILQFPFENIGLRINTNVFTGVHKRFDVSSSHSKFGVPVSRRKEIIQAYVDHPELNAIHFHLGSGITTNTPYREALNLVSNIISEIEEARASEGIEAKIRFIDMGGGLLAESDKGVFDRLQHLGEMLQDEFAELCNKYTLITEFGQYIHTHNSWLYSEIADIIDFEDYHSTLILYQGANMFVRQAYTDQSPPFTYNALGKQANKRDQVFDLAGPLCFSGDYIAKKVELPNVTIDDKIIIDSIGANTYALWSHHCSFPFPKVVGYKGEELFVLKERDSLDNISAYW
jgi:diaminopimelate decarboxylase